MRSEDEKFNQSLTFFKTASLFIVGSDLIGVQNIEIKN